MRVNLLIVTLVLFNFACRDASSEKVAKPTPLTAPIRYGPDRNVERIKKGITTVPKNYVPEGSDKYSIAWENPLGYFFNGNHLPYHDMKIINDEGGTINFERDYFYSGKMYDNPDSDEINVYMKRPQGLKITYFYHNFQDEKAGWKCILNQSDFPQEKQITIQQADSVLVSWGINRLYPDRKIK